MKQLEMCQYDTDAHAQSPSSLRNKHSARRAVKAHMKQGIQKSWKNKVCIKYISKGDNSRWMEGWAHGQMGAWTIIHRLTDNCDIKNF